MEKYNLKKEYIFDEYNNNIFILYKLLRTFYRQK